MFKRLLNLLNQELSSTEGSFKMNAAIEPSQSNTLVSTAEQAERLWEQGKLTEAITLYRQAIEQDPDAAHLYEQLTIALRQQGNVAQAYEQLAKALKQQGNREEAANYYRQAIVLKALTCDAQGKYIPSLATNLSSLSNTGDLTKTAFCFQPLTNQSRALNRQFTRSFSRQQPKKSIVEIAKKKTNKSYIKQALIYYEQQKWEETALACQKAAKFEPERAEIYKIWGNALQRMGNIVEAMNCYEKTVEIEPDLAVVYGAIAELYIQQQKWSQAIEYYQKAIVIKPKFVEAYLYLADIWQELNEPTKALDCRYQALQIELEQANKTETANNLLASTELPNKANYLLDIKPSSKSVEDYQQTAENFAQQNRWQEAAIYYRQALKLNLSQSAQSKENSPQYLHSAQTNELEDQPEKTRLEKLEQSLLSESHQSAKQADSNSTLASTKENNIVQIKSQESQLDKAIRRYRQQIKLNPNSAPIQIQLGNLYVKKRQWQAAAACYQQAIALESENAEAYFNLGKVLAKLDKTDQSVDYLYQALQLEPKLASTQEHIHLGNTLRQQRKLEQAINCYYQVVKLEPTYIKGYYLLGEVLNARGKQQEAIACYQQAIKCDRQNPESYYRLGQALIEQQQWQEAVAAFRCVLELQPDYLDAFSQLNQALVQKIKSNISSKK